jgi:uncharacterized protein (TIGR03435 family)
MVQFAQLLQSLDPGNFPNNGVADATGIKGSYDFTVSYSPQSLAIPPAGCWPVSPRLCNTTNERAPFGSDAVSSSG